MSKVVVQAQGLLEKIAEESVFFDLSDAEVIQNMGDALIRFAHLVQEIYPRSAAAAIQAAETLKHKHTKQEHTGQGQDVEQALYDLISALQSVLVNAGQEDQVSFPGMFNIDQVKAEHPGPAKDPGLLPGLDPEMLSVYVTQQVSMLSDLEDWILNYEQKRTEEELVEIKRLVHTAKGESGVLGLEVIAGACHDLEDYIQEQGKALSPDILLGFKDWFQEGIEACNTGSPIPKPEFLAQLEAQSVESNEQDRHIVKEPEPAVPVGAKQDLHDKLQRQSSPAADSILQAVQISDPEITGEFITEAQEYFETADESLITLESDPHNLDAVATVFRAFHTIKGTCGFLGLTPITELAHKAENLLDEVRKETLQFSGPVVDATFNALDMIKTMTQQLQEALSAGNDFTPPFELIKILDFVNSVSSGGCPQKQSMRAAGKSGIEHAGTPAPPTKQTPLSPAGNETDNSRSMAESQESPAAGRNGTVATRIKQSMKIEAEKIDLLLDTIGELVIVESIVTQDEDLKQNMSSNLERNLAQLTKITRGLQDMGMSMRLIPIEATFRRMARLIRDLSKKSGKQIELEMCGKETELDKSMVEKLGDPLVHMVRNSVDHGIESTPEERVAAGKPAKARITLKAYHEGGSIHIAINDDGRGLNRKLIAAKAVERGIISSAEGMSDEEIYRLIFESGFSTAAQVTDVSGRGVGMDVVRNNIESLRGNIRIHSVPGEGSTFTMVLPLTMAIIDGMLVKVGSERYILPLLSIIQSFQPTRDMLATVSGKGETLPFRNRLLPMFRLSSLFAVPDALTDPTQGIAVVVEDAGRQVAILVDQLLGQNQTVIKTLGAAMGKIPGVAGASIMSDGLPGLIIDVHGVVRMATS